MTLLKTFFSLRLSSAISKPIVDWRRERDEILERLKACYSKGQFSLFLGAGISSSAGMPDWNTLLNSLFVTYLTQEFNGDVAMSDKDVNDIVNRLNGINEPSALMAARYLRKGLSKSDGEAKEFIEAVTKNLYKLRDSNFPIASELIKSIASMCLPRRTGAKVKSVITYNFDDLLEKQLSSNSILHRCIYTNNESYDPDELPVYHVHGFLPENRKFYDGLDKSTLVFSEEGYHHIYSDSYHWSNLVQLNSFRENNCLMVGLSMTDPNLRRLLDISSKNIERSKHFTFMKRISSSEFCYEENVGKKLKIIENTESAEKFLERHHTLNEELMKELGVTIIWYEKYDDIPKFIREVVQH
ncbi:SIR2 family protein [Dickeya oryzae]